MNDAVISKRPFRLTVDQKLTCARKVVADLRRDCNGFDDISVERLAEQIAEHARDHMDGYALAKEMDSRFYWDCDLEVAMALDNWATYCREELEAAEKAWAAETKPEPPFPVGVRVGFKQWAERGVITDIYAYGTAKYLVKIDGDNSAEPPSNSRRVVNFEDVVALTDGIGAVAGEASA